MDPTADCKTFNAIPQPYLSLFSHYDIAMAKITTNPTNKHPIAAQIILSVLSNCQNPSVSSFSSSKIISSNSTSAAIKSSGLTSCALPSPSPDAGSRPARSRARRRWEAVRRTRGPARRPPGAAWATAKAPMFWPEEARAARSWDFMNSSERGFSSSWSIVVLVGALPSRKLICRS